jgi:hypothetical protein
VRGAAGLKANPPDFHDRKVALDAGELFSNDPHGQVYGATHAFGSTCHRKVPEWGPSRTALAGRPLVYRLRWACWIAWEIRNFRASGTGSLHRLDTTVRTRISNAYVSLHVLHFATSA